MDRDASTGPAETSGGGERSRGVQARAFLGFLAVPVVIVTVFLLIDWRLPESYESTVTRAVVIVLACALPAAMWFMFIATRKASLLNDFVSNLNRLGLLARCPADRESEAARRRRIFTYLQKFEALYGRVPPQAARDVLDGRFTPETSSERATKGVLWTTVGAVVLATALLVVGWLITLPPYDDLTFTDLRPEQTPQAFAFLGAYFFSVQMVFRRFVRRDLRTSAYVAICIRVLVALVFSWVLVLALDGRGADGGYDRGFLVLAFVVGVFPHLGWQVVQAVIKKAFAFAVPSLRTELPLSGLSGLTVWHEARLEEEDIENIPNLATADLVDLLLNTRFTSNRLIDWVDEAILVMHLGPDGDERRKQLRQHGIYGATVLRHVCAASPARKADQAAFDEQLFEGGAGTVPVLLAAIGRASNIDLVEMWRQQGTETGPLAGPPAGSPPVAPPPPPAAGATASTTATAVAPPVAPVPPGSTPSEATEVTAAVGTNGT